MDCKLSNETFINGIFCLELFIFRLTLLKFLSKLEDFLSEKEAERVLRTMIDWGRYAELFAYDFNTGILSLENPGISLDN